jgi:DNA-directed RNA polymerase alpha subunit
VRIYNMLAREGFSTVEQVAAVPDTALLDIRSMGGPSLTAVRDATATVGAARGGPVTGVPR